MSNKEIPEFLYGTFDWSENGYQISTSLSIDLLNASSLNDDNPWIVLAGVVERAKVSDHSAIKALRRLFYMQEPFALAGVALMVVGNAGTYDDMQLLVEAMRSDDSGARRCACQAASQAGYLWLVPHMLNAWNRATSLHDHEIIGYAISDLIETESGEIAAEASIYAPPPLSQRMLNDPRFAPGLELRKKLADKKPLFPILVQSKYDEMVTQYGTDQVVVWNGKIFSVVNFAKDLLNKIRSNVVRSYIDDRQKFEASTGIDCSAFFFDFEPQRLNIAATLEKFLKTSEIDNYEDGVRYFFGHRIPDSVREQNKVTS